MKGKSSLLSFLQRAGGAANR